MRKEIYGERKFRWDLAKVTKFCYNLHGVAHKEEIEVLSRVPDMLQNHELLSVCWLTLSLIPQNLFSPKASGDIDRGIGHRYRQKSKLKCLTNGDSGRGVPMNYVLVANASHLIRQALQYLVCNNGIDSNGRDKGHCNFRLSKVWHTWTAAEWRDNQTGSNAINICVERGVGHFDQIPHNQRSRCLQFSRLILLLWFGSRNHTLHSPLDGEPDGGYVPRIHIHAASEAH
ncbi:hypothetical protein DBV15_03615 [Temnothorax longispinosus]|uniref:Uncharacterized protein n=1 Tax=Temnothorax longispinosus TaxID=300112 RepID=A0A4S2KKH6_9HYME|nr:hypothetical protein DBV15_03615 [Temnothorax longispinosus]